MYTNPLADSIKRALGKRETPSGEKFIKVAVRLPAQNPVDYIDVFDLYLPISEVLRHA